MVCIQQAHSGSSTGSLYVVSLRVTLWTIVSCSERSASVAHTFSISTEYNIRDAGP